ncbi:methyltransferase domain-containing protein [Candidatus Dependentiae bacterium]|nr:methyltransferase domain-containing protein [Candidatus Dependentiae bacterium]
MKPSKMKSGIKKIADIVLKKTLGFDLKKIVEKEVEAKLSIIVPQLIDLHTGPIENRQSYHNNYQNPYENAGIFEDIKNQLVELNVPVKEEKIDIEDFEKWMNEFSEIQPFYKNGGDVFIEKCLEHYLNYKYLNISEKNVYIDFAAAGSPWADILNKKNIKSYRLDLSYPDGINGINIGADAANTKLPDEFCDVISMQCAYECFMGNADVNFLSESSRILKKNGRFGIIPLYLDKTFFISTSPYCDSKNIIIDDGAKKVWRDDQYKAPFSRHYSPEIFKERIFFKLPENMKGYVIYFKNMIDIMKHYKNQRIYCFFMLYCEKNK